MVGWRLSHFKPLNMKSYKVLQLGATAAFAALLIPSLRASESDIHLPDLNTVSFHGRRAERIRGPAYGPRRVRHRDALRLDPVHPDAQPAGPLVDGGRLERDLGDLQDVPRPAGQVPRRAVGPDRGLHDLLLQRALGPDAGARRRHPPGVDPRHPRQLRRRLVRHPDQHGRQFAHGVLRPEGQCRSRRSSSRSSRG